MSNSISNNPTLVVIAGPTAVGKTSLSIKLAKYFSTVIVSADSRQFYKELNVGTAPPTLDERTQVTHYFIQHLSIFDYFNVSRFENEALSLLTDLYKIYNPIFLVGGSGLYIDALCKGIDDMPDYDPEFRQNLIEKLNSEGIEWFRSLLKKLDPETYNKIDLRNKNRIFRAVEVCLQTGRPYSSFLKYTPKKRSFNIVKIAIYRERQELYELINKRLDIMIEQGLVDEAKSLYPYRYLVPLKTVGYKELFDYFDGKYNLSEAIELIKRNTRHYARKQLTWFRRDKDYQWFHATDYDKIKSFIEQKLNEKTIF